LGLARFLGGFTAGFWWHRIIDWWSLLRKYTRENIFPLPLRTHFMSCMLWQLAPPTVACALIGRCEHKTIRRRRFEHYYALVRRTDRVAVLLHREK
jgi:hypothetical protein